VVIEVFKPRRSFFRVFLLSDVPELNIPFFLSFFLSFSNFLWVHRSDNSFAARAGRLVWATRRAAPAFDASSQDDSISTADQRAHGKLDLNIG
jgi:hypothetical protein